MTGRREDNAIRGVAFGIGVLLLVTIGVIVLAVIWQHISSPSWLLLVIPLVGFLGGLIFGGDY